MVGDHKLLWELNRHQYLLATAFCWLLDKEARRFDLIQSHLESWLADNPPRQGVNRVSSLEVAYRAIAWCWLLWMLREAPWRRDLRTRLLSALEACAARGALPLDLFQSQYPPYGRGARAVLRRDRPLGFLTCAPLASDGRGVLETAIKRQVHGDGVYFEQASQYHRYTTEIYLHYLLLANASGLRVSDTVRDALGNLFAVLRVSLPRRAGCRCSGTTTVDCYSPWIIARLMMYARCCWPAL